MMWGPTLSNNSEPNIIPLAARGAILLLVSLALFRLSLYVRSKVLVID